MKILQYFRGTPRKTQTEILNTLEDNWVGYDVFVIQAPVATGKSRVAVAVSDWVASLGRSSAILTPSNILADQYAKDFPDISLLHRRQWYRNPQSYATALHNFGESQQVIANYWVPLAHRITKDVFIYDEAHNLVEQGGTPIKLWQHLFNWPDDITDTIDLLEWAQTAHTGVQSRDTLIQRVIKLLDSDDGDAVLEFDHEEYRGNMRRLLKITPLSCRADKPIFWPRTVRKLILMSATINEYDIYNLGLDKKRVLYIECGSEIPAANRPVIPLNVVSINHSNIDYTLPKLKAQIDDILGKHNTPGIIHCTYELASRLRSVYGEDHPRLRWHGASNRTSVFNSFVDGDLGGNAVLVACGMSEGVDLAYKLARWQIICKIPYRSLADSKVRENCKKHPHLYAWWAIRTVMQATGRVCRSPDDYGLTYILDSNFARLTKEWPELWPDYYKHSIIDKGVVF